MPIENLGMRALFVRETSMDAPLFPNKGTGDGRRTT